MSIINYLLHACLDQLQDISTSAQLFFAAQNDAQNIEVALHELTHVLVS